MSEDQTPPKKNRRGRPTKSDPGLADRIYEARLQANLTLREFAEKIGVSYETASRYETGATAPSRERMSDLARVLQVTLETLLPGVPAERAGSTGRLEHSDDANARHPILRLPYPSSVLDRLPELMKWWRDYELELSGKGFLWTQVRRIELGLREIDNIRFRIGFESEDTRTFVEVREQWLEVLPALIADVQRDAKRSQVLQSQK